MKIFNDLKTLYHLAVSPVKGSTHQERLESFYRKQAKGYDDFRQRLLPGRKEMFARLPLKPGDIWIDMGAGTGSNLNFAKPRLNELNKVYLVDLSPSLLKQARLMTQRNGWNNIVLEHNDVCTFVPEEKKVDVITFSYSLTMIPEWHKALMHAHALLKPGGTIGIVDFYVSPKYPKQGFARHGWATRNFWKLWFEMDNVYLCADHMPFLNHLFDRIEIQEGRHRMPYLLGLKAPFYHFIGRKP